MPRARARARRSTRSIVVEICVRLHRRRVCAVRARSIASATIDDRIGAVRAPGRTACSRKRVGELRCVPASAARVLRAARRRRSAEPRRADVCARTCRAERASANRRARRRASTLVVHRVARRGVLGEEQRELLAAQRRSSPSRMRPSSERRRELAVAQYRGASSMQLAAATESRTASGPTRMIAMVTRPIASLERNVMSMRRALCNWCGIVARKTPQ